MVLLSDFLQCFESSVLLTDYIDRLRYYYFFPDGSCEPIEFVGHSYIGEQVYYHFRPIRSSKSPLLSCTERECRYSCNFIGVRPKRAFRDWFESQLLPY